MHSRQVEGLFSAHSTQPLSQRMSRIRPLMLMSPLPLLSLLFLRELQLSRPVQLEQKKGQGRQKAPLGKKPVMQVLQVIELSVPRAQEEQPGVHGTHNPCRTRYPAAQVVQVVKLEQLEHWAC